MGNYLKPERVHNISRICKSEGSEVRIVLNEFTDGTNVDLRRYYKTKKMEKFAPTPKGFSIPVEQLPALIKALRKAQRAAEEEGLFDD